MPTSTKYLNAATLANVSHLVKFQARQAKALASFEAKQEKALRKFTAFLDGRLNTANKRDSKADAVVAKRAMGLLDREAAKAQKLVDAEEARKARVAKYEAEKALRAETRQAIKDQKAGEKLEAASQIEQLIAVAA